MLKKIASNTIAQIISKILTAIIAIFLISILTNYLSVEMYGLYSKVYNYIWIFVFLADLWLYAIAIREITANKKDSAKIVWNVMSLRLFLGIFILFFCVFIAYFLPGYNSSLALISIAIASVFTIFQLLNSSILALMQANMKIEFSAFSLVLSKILNVWLIASIAYIFFTKENIWEGSDAYSIPFLMIMWVWVVSVLLNTLLNFWYARRIVRFGFAFDWEYIKYIFRISLPYGIALFLSVVYFKVDVILLSLLEWPERGDVSIALYSLPMKIIEVLMVIGWFYMTSLLPSLTEFFKPSSSVTSPLEGGTQVWDKNNLIALSFRILFAGAIMIFSLWVLFRDSIIRIIANEDYLLTGQAFNSSDAFFIVLAVIVFYFISLVFIYCLVAANQQSKLLKINIIVTLFNIIGNIILIPKYSFIGAGIVTLLSQIFLMILAYFATKKLIIFHLPLAFVVKNIIFGALVYTFWYIVLFRFSVGLYFDFFIYGWILFAFYCFFLYRSFRFSTWY